MTEAKRSGDARKRDTQLTAFMSQLGRSAKAERISVGLSRGQLSLRKVAQSQIRRIEAGDPRVTVAELWTYARRLGVRTTQLVPREHTPFDDLEERAEARSARLRVLTRLRRRKLPRPRSVRNLIRVRAAGPLASESQLIEPAPVFDVDWPEAVTAAQRRIDSCLATKLLAEVAALARTYDAFLVADLGLARDIESFADPRSAWLYQPHRDQDLGRALQLLAGNLQSYIAAAGALIDHARRFRRRYAAAGTANGTAYDQRINATFGGPESVIVKCLRNYALHHSLPVVIGQQQEATAEGWPTVVFVDAAGLLDGEFSAHDKALLRVWTVGIPMAPLIGMYSAHVVSFYKWLAARIPVWYREADEELAALTRDLQRALAEAGLGELPRLFDQLDRSKRGEVGATGATRPASSQRATVHKKSSKDQREARSSTRRSSR